MFGRRLRLWFGFDHPVDRRTYFTNGLGLMVVKYALDAALIGAFTGRFWTPLDYLNPLLTLRTDVLRDAPGWVAPALILIALPFLWVGVSMSVRRAVQAGLSAWSCLLFFVPVINYAWMLVLSILPPRAPRGGGGRPAAEPPRVDERFTSAMQGVAASLGITLATVFVGVYLRRTYSAGLFLGVPFTIGYVSSYIYNRRAPRPAGESILIALASVGLAGGAMILFALEGAICTLMALPIALIVAWPAAVLGRVVARHGIAPGAGVGTAMILAPLMIGVEPRAAPAPHEVVTVVEISAPPEVVWTHVVSFPELPPATEWWFRAGVAAPVGARLEGVGVGATRYCDFTTGSFTEPVTVWEEGRRLAFDITAQPAPMRELSPYDRVDAPHLSGYFRATHGEFLLRALPGGRTRLEGRTTYVVEMFPQAYWTPMAGAIVTAIHERVLEHIKRLSEEGE